MKNYFVRFATSFVHVVFSAMVFFDPLKCPPIFLFRSNVSNPKVKQYSIFSIYMYQRLCMLEVYV